MKEWIKFRHLNYDRPFLNTCKVLEMVDSVTLSKQISELIPTHTRLNGNVFIKDYPSLSATEKIIFVHRDQLSEHPQSHLGLAQAYKNYLKGNTKP